MGFTTGKGLHVDRHLTNIAINYSSQNFIAGTIAPVVPVNKQSDSYPIFSRHEAFAIEDTVRAPGTEAKKITRSVSSAKYDASNYALGRDITIEDEANMDEAYRTELGIGATTYLVDKLMLDWERRVTNIAVTTASVGSVFVPNSAWGGGNSNAGDPIIQTFQLIEHVQGTTGQRPNSLWFGWRAWNAFRRNYHARNFVNGVANGGGIVRREQIASLFEVDRIIVSDAMYHTVNEAHVNSLPLANAMENQLIAYFAPNAPSRESPSWFYSFRWQNPTLPTPFAVERHPYDTRRKVETIEAGYYQDEVVVGADYAGRLITTAASGAAGLG
jgi:hypothetical protein